MPPSAFGVILPYLWKGSCFFGLASFALAGQEWHQLPRKDHLKKSGRFYQKECLVYHL